MAEELKDEGNAFFKSGRYAEAVAKYNDAIELNPEVHTVGTLASVYMFDEL